MTPERFKNEAPPFVVSDGPLGWLARTAYHRRMIGYILRKPRNYALPFCPDCLSVFEAAYPGQPHLECPQEPPRETAPAELVWSDSNAVDPWQLDAVSVDTRVADWLRREWLAEEIEAGRGNDEPGCNEDLFTDWAAAFARVWWLLCVLWNPEAEALGE